jgi:hypothetical protein
MRFTSGKLTRAWHWLTDVTDIKTRRIILIGFLVLCTFNVFISQFAARYAAQIEGVLGLVIIVCSLGGLVLLADAAWKGRRARRARRRQP